MAEIRLYNGQVTLVDEGDVSLVSKYRWHISGKGYVSAQPGRGRHLFMHRLIAGASPNEQVDHINGDKLDNRKSNLRLCTNQQNNFNRPGERGSTSRFKGVQRYTYKGANCWRAAIRHNGKYIHIGMFKDETTAALAYDAKARELFGVFAFTNFPIEETA